MVVLAYNLKLGKVETGGSLKLTGQSVHEWQVQ